MYVWALSRGGTYIHSHVSFLFHEGLLYTCVLVIVPKKLIFSCIP